MNDKYQRIQQNYYTYYIEGWNAVNRKPYEDYVNRKSYEEHASKEITLGDLKQLIKDANIPTDDVVNTNNKRYILIGA